MIGVNGTEATLGATIVPGGASTTYRFDYVDEAAFLAEGFAGPGTRSTGELGPLPAADNSPHSISVTITGLGLRTAYRFRVVATNGKGEVEGETPGAFRTQSSQLIPAQNCPNQALRTGPSAALPDCRAYEQVTPVDKGGLYIEGFADLVAASPDGSAVSYISGAGSGFPAKGGARQDTTTFLSSLDDGAWSAQRLLPPEEFGRKAGFLGASRNMRFVVVAAGTTDESGLFLIDTDSESVTQIAPYQSERELSRAFAYDAISDDGSRVFFESRAKLLPEATSERTNLYMWAKSSDEVSLVGILPEGEGGQAPAGGSFGSAYAWFEENTGAGGASSGLYVEAVNAASSDGDQIYFTAGESGQLYLRRGLTGPNPTSVHVSEPAAGVSDPNGPRPAAFQEATPDGSRAFVISSEKLTGDASTGVFDSGTDLYRYDALADELVDITGDQESNENPNGAEVQGLLGVGADGSSGYFAARGVLAAGAIAGENNIYRFEEEGSGSFSFILVTTVGGFPCVINSSGDNWSPSSYCGDSAIGAYVGKSSRVTPDGKELVFTKNKQINIYSADTEEVTCLSCSDTGTESAGAAELTAGFLNGTLGVVPSVLPAARLTHSVSDDGSRVFFQTPNSLVAEDTNGPPDCTYLTDNPVIGKLKPSCIDVYEWEAPDAPGGSCTKAEVNGGCLYLLSAGNSKEGSYLMDASSDGKVAFIATSSQLVPVDRDELYDVYGVRTGGGIASQQITRGTPCDAESCRGAPTQGTPPSAPGSSLFTGPSNVKAKKHKPCHRGHRRCKRKNNHGKHGKNHEDGRSGKGEQR